MSANMLDNAGLCRRDCQGERGGYAGSVGDVERCEHGNVLVCWRTLGPWSDWARISPFWDRRKYRRAVAALTAAPVPVSDGEDNR